MDGFERSISVDRETTGEFLQETDRGHTPHLIVPEGGVGLRVRDLSPVTTMAEREAKG